MQRKRTELAGSGPKAMNTLALLIKTQSLNYEGVIKLNDHISVTMQNSFLIKNNASGNFEKYAAMMKKKGTTNFGSPEKSPERRSDSPFD